MSLKATQLAVIFWNLLINWNIFLPHRWNDTDWFAILRSPDQHLGTVGIGWRQGTARDRNVFSENRRLFGLGIAH